jgi:phosphomannomutase
MNDIEANLKSQVKDIIKDQLLIEKCYKFIDKKDFWSVANLLGEYYNFSSINKKYKESCKDIISEIRNFMGEKAKNSKETTLVVFGTSGWRGRIGVDFTLLNVHKVSRAIIDMMMSKEFIKKNNYTSFTDVQEKGILVFRDNRYLGEEFMDASMKELANAGIKIFFAGECPTGIGSALVNELGVAGSFNFTPSHNPMDYAGLKFNPSDGGPADSELTNRIMQESIKYMKEDSSFTPATTMYVKKCVNASELFINFLRKNKIVNITELKKYLSSVKEQLFIAIDNMHGSSRGYIQDILGKELISELEKNKSIKFINTEDDYSFHGVKPEPSASNMKPLIQLAKDSKRTLTLVVSLDPDGDRIRFGTADMDIDMNKFGALAYASLLDSGAKGPIASSLPTSDFALAIAKKEKQTIYETKVGFKWFRPYRDALICFEESDGISMKAHTLEKDAIIGFLLALYIMKNTKKNISDYYNELQERYGYYYPSKTGVDVIGVSVEEWEEYKKNVVNTLHSNSFIKENDIISIQDKEKTVFSLDKRDGLKIVFSDNSWLLLRPSGTEPKFRIYLEVTSETKLTEPSIIIKEYIKTGKELLDKARIK